MTNQQPTVIVRGLVDQLLAAWPGGYQGLRAVLEELADAVPVDGFFAPRQAARDYLASHCQICGASLSDAEQAVVDELELLHAGVTDWAELGGIPEPFCPTCYVRHVEDDDGAWVAELTHAQQEQSTGLFGRSAAQVRLHNHHLRQ